MKQRDYGYYIELAKERQGFKFDNQIDAALGFKGSMMNIVQRGKKHLSEEKMIELAKLAGVDPVIALLDLNHWRSEGEAKKAYRKLLEKITAAALCLMFLSATPPANAAVLAGASANADLYIITSGLLRRLGKIASLFKGLFTTVRRICAFTPALRLFADRNTLTF